MPEALYKCTLKKTAPVNSKGYIPHNINWYFISLRYSKQHAQITQLIPAAWDSPALLPWPALCLPAWPRTPCQEQDGWYDLVSAGQLSRAHPCYSIKPKTTFSSKIFHAHPLTRSCPSPEAVPPWAAKQHCGLVCWPKLHSILQDLLNTLTGSVSPWSREEATAWHCKLMRCGPRERANPCLSLRLSK